MTPQLALKKFASKSRAAGAAQFFKTGKGQYGEGDIFIGVTVPDVRKVAREFSDLSFAEIAKLIKSNIHEERLLALRILADRYPKDSEAVYRFYLKHLDHVNNWDLVDTSAPEISGPYLFAHPKERGVLTELARSHNLWRRRVAMISTFYFIRQKREHETLRIAKMLLNDEHDLIHKAVGWMLRELGKRHDRRFLDDFLTQNAKKMPRTALRYAIELHSPAERKYWLSV